MLGIFLQIHNIDETSTYSNALVKAESKGFGSRTAIIAAADC